MAVKGCSDSRSHERNDMPTGIREDGKARRIAIDILGVPISGFADSSGKKKKYRKGKKNGKGSNSKGETKGIEKQNENY